MGILKNGMIVISPIDIFDDGVKYITKNKEYKIHGVTKKSDMLFYIEDDNKQETTCLLKSCAHLDFKDWIIKKQD